MQLYKIFFVVFDSATMEIYSEFYYKQGAAERDRATLEKAYAGNKKLKVGKVMWDLKEERIDTSEPQGLRLKPGTVHATNVPRFVAGE